MVWHCRQYRLKKVYFAINTSASFQERSSLALQVICSQQEISYAEALHQVERLKQASKLNSSSKKGRQQHSKIGQQKKLEAPE
ncbi:hypothetical protein SAMN05444277_104223 [Parafilimonas terrae]|uniref:Uncharacterized protein n=1 Tax=Parafilimonas terrae TaxID=1465490 RepID=A0A1I5V5G7_9BACT|nr:hypothetical protein SAMN05444277_104223 [Parafilimonas terrae]